MGSRHLRPAVVLRLAALLLLAAQAAYYAFAYAEEQRFIEARILPRIGRGGDPRQILMRTLDVSFHLPPHRGLPIHYGLRNPLMHAFRASAVQVFQKGGPCSKRSRLLVVLLEAQGIPAHKLFLYDRKGLTELHDPPRAWVHVVVEAKIDGRWIVADPLFDLVFPRPDGRLASADDLRNDPALLHAGRARADERYDYWMSDLYDYQDVRRFPWFMFGELGDPIYAALIRLVPKPALDRMTTPSFFERPQLAIVLFSLMGMVLVALGFVPRRRAGAEPARAPALAVEPHRP